jgi:hypothetical protein
MPGGARIDGLAGLRRLLLNERSQFVGTVTEKLLAYSLGRALTATDKPIVRHIVRESAAQDYRWTALIEGIVESPAFQRRRTQAANATQTAAAIAADPFETRRRR